MDNKGSPSMTSSPNGNPNSKPGFLGVPVVGVFTLLTECYSPTCSRDNLCYSIVCPRRLEQQARLGSKSSLTRSDSHLSLTQKEEQKAFWSYTVPKSILDSMDKREIKRQECIFEMIYSERDFVKDLEYLREFWIRPLSETKIIKENEREHFVNTVFYNINEIWEINSRFAEALTKRQQEKPVVDEIGDLFLEFIPRFEPFVKYGAGQVKGKYEFDRQKRHNPFFVRFIEDTSNRAESRRLDVSSYLSKPTTRPARYPLLLKSIRDHTDPESKDYANLNKAIELLQKMLTRINYETGKAADRLNLFLLKQKLVFRPGEYIDLRLTSEHRKLLYQCVLKKRNYQDKEKQGEVQVYLFDHALLFVRIKVVNKREVYRVYQRPIPLPLLFVSLTEESPSIKQIKKSASTGSLTGSLTGSTSSLLFKDAHTTSGLHLATTSAKCPISFTYLGRSGYDLTLYATPTVQRMLIDKLETQTRKLIDDNDVFTLTPLTSNFFDHNNKINCVVPFDGGRKLLYGTDSGIYVSDVKITDNGSRVVSRPVKIISKINIIQVEILSEYQTLLALSDKKLFYWPGDVLSGGDAVKNGKLGKELMTHVSFFKTGVCAGRMLVCAAKSSSNLIRIFEPIDPISQRKQKKSSHRRQKTLVSTPSRFRSAFSRPSYVWVVRKALRLFLWKRTRSSSFWMLPTRLSTLWSARKASSPWRLTESTPTSCSATQTFPFSSTTAAGGRDPSGSSTGRVFLTLLLCGTRIFWPLILVLLRFATLRVESFCASSSPRRSASCTPAHRRFCMHTKMKEDTMWSRHLISGIKA
ncbi:uncharacterized protein OGAPODRAFT_16752 [Ogataea polymorpha]|uniref:uncharacterized protein n=1 Tax=Ogataea polymorpha TaxID=460523 RepID=UPI0007F54ED6|nr:uncharacterized protein OGAPODRAFT_16752 [Ogataea polymorpha]OBA14732.1 hypothetical protein OGAPODRAFT_16752 [Ogataea polymorpha]